MVGMQGEWLGCKAFGCQETELSEADSLNQQGSPRIANDIYPGVLRLTASL